MIGATAGSSLVGISVLTDNPGKPSLSVIAGVHAEIRQYGGVSSGDSMIGITSDSSLAGFHVLTDIPGGASSSIVPGVHAQVRTYGVVASDTLKIEQFDSTGNWVWGDGEWVEWGDGEVVEQ